MARYVVGTVAEIPPGARKIVTVAGRSIGVFNLGGEFFALRNRCPHQGGPLCEGKTWGAVQATVPGAIEYDRAGEILTCAWHGWEFGIRTGQSWCAPERLHVRRYAVTVEPAVPPVPIPMPPAPGLAPGPYIAETYAVAVEEQQIVVDVPR